MPQNSNFAETVELVTEAPRSAAPVMENRSLECLSRAVAAHLQGNPEDALKELESLNPGPDFSEALHARAVLKAELKQYPEAAADWEQLAVLWPHNPEPHHECGLCWFHLGRWEKALGQFDAALQLSPNSAEFLTSKGTCLLRMKRPEDALEAFDAALRIAPGLERALLGRGAALQMSYEIDEAEQAYSTLLERNPDSKEALTNLAGIGLLKKDDNLVREASRRLLSVDPDSEIALLALSNISFRAGAFEAAAQHSARLVRLYPQNHDYWYNLGVAEERRGKLDSAALAFENAAAADQSSAPALLAAATVHERLGDLAATRIALDRVLALNPADAELRYQIGAMAERQGEKETAEKIYEGLDGHLNAQFQLGFLKLERGDAEGAAKCFEASLRARPEWREAEINLSLAYTKLGRNADAQAVLVKLLEREPSCSEALQGSAAIALASNPPEALRCLEQLRQSEAKSREVAFNAGVLHQKSGEWPQAATCYREALALDPQFTEARVNLGHVLAAMGDEQGARDAWTLALASNPDLARGYFSSVEMPNCVK